MNLAHEAGFFSGLAISLMIRAQAHCIRVMARAVLFALMLSLLDVSFAFAQNQQDTDVVVVAKLTAQNHRVLSGRFHKILEFRLRSLSQCDFETHAALDGRFRKLESSSPERAEVAATLQLYLDSYGVSSACRQKLDRAEARFHKAERRVFKPLNGLIAAMCVSEFGSGMREVDCRSRLLRVFSELDPNCISVQVDNPLGVYDGFPCMAGDYMVGRDLSKDTTVQSFVHETRVFLQAVRLALSDRDLRARGIELYSLYLGRREDSAQLRARFLALITMLNASTHSLTSYTQGHHHHFARETLFKTRSAQSAIDAFVGTRLLTDEYRTLFRWAGDRGVESSILTQKTQDMNRHNYMAAYLACRYREEPKFIRESLPKLLGLAYETFDFASHIREGMSLGEAWAAMKMDIRRYREGVDWGLEFCTNQISNPLI